MRQPWKWIHEACGAGAAALGARILARPASAAAATTALGVLLALGVHRAFPAHLRRASASSTDASGMVRVMQPAPPADPSLATSDPPPLLRATAAAHTPAASRPSSAGDMADLEP